MIDWGRGIGPNTGALIEQLLRRYKHPEHGYRSALEGEQQHQREQQRGHRQRGYAGQRSSARRYSCARMAGITM